MTITSSLRFLYIFDGSGLLCGGGSSVPKKGTGQSPVQNKKQPKLAHGHNGLKLCNMVTLIEPEWFSLTKKKKLGLRPHQKRQIINNVCYWTTGHPDHDMFPFK